VDPVGIPCFSECEPVPDARPLQQGDVLRSLEPPAEIWDATVIVVTADCDLAKTKHAGRLTCVPVLPAPVYLSLFYAPRRLAKIQQALAEHLTGLMRKAQSAHHPQFSVPLTEARCREWLQQSSPEAIAKTLEMSPKEEGTFVPMAHSFRESADALDGPLAAQCDAYASVYEALGRRGGRRTGKASLLSEIADHLRELPGDALFLNSVGNGPADGYVAYLRVLMSVKDAHVALKPHQRSFEVTYERIAHLRSPYLYRLTQQLGSVFNAIGLPSDYESSRDSTAQQFLDRLG
jgi:hypothetical protein